MTNPSRAPSVRDQSTGGGSGGGPLSVGLAEQRRHHFRRDHLPHEQPPPRVVVPLLPHWVLGPRLELTAGGEQRR